MEGTNKKPIVFALIIGIIFILCAVGYIACSASNRKWQRSAEAFERKVAETLSIYGDSIHKWSVEKQNVSIYVDTERWNNTDASNQKAFMNEVVSLLQADAASSGITDYTTVWITFHETSKGIVGEYTLKKE